MNVRKPVDYTAMFTALDTLMAEVLPQMELYREIGKLVSGRPEKGAAVAAAEHLNSAYPDASGFSPRNLRRMRDFYQAYEGTPEVLDEAMTIGWTQNVVILDAELTIQEKVWYIQAVRQFGWSKLELTGMIQERTHETADLDIADDPCYSNGRRGDGDGTKETSGTFLQGLRDAEVQREFQRQGPCGPHLQSLFLSLTGTTGRADDTPPLGKSADAPPDRERDGVAEKSHPRSPARGEGPGLYGLCGKISSFGTKPEKAGNVHPNAGIEYQWRGLRSLWRPGVCQGELSSQPNAASHRLCVAGWNKPDNRAAAQDFGKAAEMDGTHAGNLLVGTGLLQPCRCGTDGRGISLVERPCGILQRRGPRYEVSG